MKELLNMKDPVARGNDWYANKLNELYAYNLAKAKDYSKKYGFDVDDWLQEGRLAIWKVGEGKPQHFYFKAVDWAMLNFYNDMVKEELK